MWIFYLFFFFWLHFNKIGIVLISFFYSCYSKDFAAIRSTPETTQSAIFSAEGQYECSKHIEACQTCCNQCDGIKRVIPCIKGNSYNIILAEKTIEEGETA